MPRLTGTTDTPDAQAVFAPLADLGRLALAVSGGADSLALLLLAHRYCIDAAGRPDRFLVLSVDHGLRPEAADEAAFVVREARRLGFPARVLRWEGEKPRTGIQEAARLARYRLFAAAMAEEGAEVLLTAHHLGDQAETVLMRLAHGSGIEGLRGMDYFSQVGDLTIVRPLLGVDPGDLRRLVASAGLTPVADPSNGDVDYERVRWRQLLPQLAALGLDARRLAKFAERMRDADGALINMSSQAFAQVTVAADGSHAVIERALLRQLPRAVAVRVVARTLQLVGGGRKPHALATVEALAARLIREPVRTTLHGCIVRSGRVSVRVSREPGRAGKASARREEPSVS